MSDRVTSTTLLRLLVLGCVAALSGCGAGNGGPADPAAELAIPVPLFMLTDQEGEPFGTGEMRHKLAVVNFIFTSCRSTCPIQTAQMGNLQDRLAADPLGDEVRLVSISVDPETDTVEVLRTYAENAHADPERWTFLTGDRDAIWRLSRDGFKLAVGDSPGDADSPLFHSDKLVVLDRRGRIRGYFDALSNDGADEVERALRRLAVESSDPPVPANYPGIDLDGADHFADPAEILDPPWMEGRRLAQMGTLDQFRVFHDFRFEDVTDAGGITFRHKVTDDGAQKMKPVHYDHGNGIPIADVDGDGWLDIYMINQVGPNELWRNLGDGRFENVTERAGVAVEDPISITAAFGDIDNDGDPDLYVTTIRRGNFLFENDGTGRFRDISKASGLDHRGHSSSPVFFDYDRDGRLDVFLTNVGRYTSDELLRITPAFPEFAGDARYEYHLGYLDAFSGHLKPERDERSLLFRNVGNNRFEDVSDRVGLLDISWTGDATPMDGNADGWPDLYVVNMQGHDEYYENVGGERFVARSREMFPRTSWGAMGVKSFDWNNDGLQDLFVTDMHSDMMENIEPEREKLKSRKMWPESLLRSQGMSIFGNSFFENRGDGRFEEISDEIGVENYWPWGFSVGDFNADGWLDVFIASSMNLAYRYGVNSLLLNNAGERFMDSEFILGIEPRPGGTAMPWFELDCPEADTDAEANTGWGEGFVNRCCEGRSGRVVVWAAKGSRTSAIFDVDGDGDLDIVSGEFHARPRVLRSNLSEANPDLRYVKLALVGSRSNRDGLGATVRVRIGDRTLHQVQDGKSGYLSQSSQPLYFGLGEAATIDRIEVDWPSGARQVLEGPLEVNRLIRIEEPA
jgi:cytochrome oxidase Cu insertion factor (SCO1/SenC/PrrC family)